MMFLVKMIVNIPDSVPKDKAEEIKKTERDYSQRLQREGKWLHLWRIVGRYENYSVFEVKDNQELHELLTGLPLFPYMDIEVIPMCKHPSSIK